MRLEDVERVYEIDQKELKSNWKENNYRFELLDINTRAFVYEQNQKVIGFVIAKKLIDSADLYQIIVDKDYKNEGYGSKLLRHCLTQLKQEGVLECLLEVRQSHSDVIGFYRKHGFEAISVRRNYYGRNKNALIMKCKVK